MRPNALFWIVYFYIKALSPFCFCWTRYFLPVGNKCKKSFLDISDIEILWHHWRCRNSIWKHGGKIMSMCCNRIAVHRCMLRLLGISNGLNFSPARLIDGCPLLCGPCRALGGTPGTESDRVAVCLRGELCEHVQNIANSCEVCARFAGYKGPFS